MFDFNLQFARGGADFTVQLFSQLAAGGVKENIIFSPFSVQAGTALAFAGAQGETADQIANVMKFVSNFPPEVAETFQFVLEKYKSSDIVKIANKVYVQEGKKLKADYSTALKESYHAEADEVNFSDSSAAADAINAWVENKTNGRIKNLISADSVGPLTRLVLLNAIHFKGSWLKKFDESQTAEDNFWLNENDSVQVTYMNQKAKFNYGYFEDLEATALELPYQDSDLSLFVLLPAARDGLKSLAEKLKGINLVDLGEKLSEEEVIVKLPKFKVEYSAELSTALKNLGLTKVFSDGAEFNNMLENPEEINVSNIFHKASIEVNEEGTEAAAATGLVMMTRCLLMPLQFEADHPFLYLIWNKKNILFAGAFVNAPSS